MLCGAVRGDGPSSLIRAIEGTWNNQIVTSHNTQGAVLARAIFVNVNWDEGVLSH